MPKPDNSSKFTSGWLTRSDCTALAGKARDRLASHAKLLARHSSEIDRAKQSAVSSLRHLPADRRGQAVRDTVRGARIEQARMSKDARVAHVREIVALGEQAAKALPFYSNPVAVLNRRTLADPKRQTYAANLADAGPAELKQLAEFAAATGDYALAYACIARCDRMPNRDRPFSRRELADHMVGDECYAAQVALREVELAGMQAFFDDTAFETGETSPQRALEIAAKRREFDRYVAGRKPVEEEPQDDLNPEERRIADEIKASLGLGGDA